jgi:hypothetical protein
MTLKLSDIMDLDYLLALDERPETADSADAIAERDREIFRQMDAGKMNDRDLLLSWLDFRKLLFFDQAGPSGFRRLPGQVFSQIFVWAARGLSLAGAVSGMALVYAFLAYHGTRPVNVALFFCVFVLVPVVFLVLTLAGLVVRHFRRTISGNGIFFSLVSVFLFHMVPKAVEKVWKKSGKSITDPDHSGFHDVLFFIRSRKQAYGYLFFWPLLTLLSVFALFFSLGALGGTLFRVTFSDVAFGWQSTLSATPSTVHGLVSLVSLPWAAWVPDALAGPTLTQVEGSRIILKQGIAELATTDLVSWWPFLCLSLLCYAVVPRLLLIIGAATAQQLILNRFEFHPPRFRRLIVRMKSPVMDIGYTELPGNRPGPENTPENPDLQGATESATGPTCSEKARHRPGRADTPAPRDAGKGTAVSADMTLGTPAVVLAPASVWDRNAVDRIRPLLGRQFLLDVKQVVSIALDPDADSLLLGPSVLDGADPVVLLQEVWQPPIRGLLHYLVQLKQGVLRDKNLWVLLIQAPDEENLGVADTDRDARVWQETVSRLGHPDIQVERIRP